MYVINRLEALEVVSLGLAPGSNSGILDDAASISRGHIRLGDCWAELEKCYTEAVKVLLRHRLTWSVGDEEREKELWRVRGQGTILPSWESGEIALWPLRLPRLRKFVSLDEETTSIVEHLERTIADMAPRWTKTDIATWELDDDRSREIAHVVDSRPDIPSHLMDVLLEVQGVSTIVP